MIYRPITSVGLASRSEREENGREDARECAAAQVFAYSHNKQSSLLYI